MESHHPGFRTLNVYPSIYRYPRFDKGFRLYAQWRVKFIPKSCNNLVPSSSISIETSKEQNNDTPFYPYRNGRIGHPGCHCHLLTFPSGGLFPFVDIGNLRTVKLRQARPEAGPLSHYLFESTPVRRIPEYFLKHRAVFLMRTRQVARAH